jgi:hypothetical protein
MPSDIEIETEPTRTSRVALERQMTVETPAPVEVSSDGSPDPEAFLAETQKTLAKREEELAAAKREKADLLAQKTRAEREAQRANQGRVSDRQAAVAAAVESANSERQAAINALKAARETGDFDGELKALDALSNATYRLNSASAELAQAKVSGEPTSAAGNVQDQPDGQIDSQSQAWIADHPRFEKDPAYRQAILDAHYQTIRDGVKASSPAYFRELDRVASMLDGTTNQGDRDVSQQNSGGRQSFGGAPPSRNGNGGGGGKTVNTALGPVTVYTKSDGRKSVSVPQHLKADFEEGAKVCNMPLGEYILDMAEHGQEGLITSEGTSYR